MLTNITSIYVAASINFILLFISCVFIYLKYNYNNLAISIISGISLYLVLLMSYINITLGLRKMDDIKKENNQEINKKEYNKVLAFTIIGIIILSAVFLFLIGVFIKQDYI